MTQVVTPWSGRLPERQYQIIVPMDVVQAGKQWNFEKWNDGSTNPIKTVNLIQDVSLNATFKEVTQLVNVTFSGSVSAQAEDGEVVTITVWLPDGSTDVLTAKTLPDKTFSTSKSYGIAGQYSVDFHIDADAIYASAEVLNVPFQIQLATRTLAVNVVVG